MTDPTDPYGSLDTLWPHTRALYEHLLHVEPTPLYAATVREHGTDPIREARLASVEAIGRAS